MATTEAAVVFCEGCATPVEYTEENVRKRARKAVDGTITRSYVVECPGCRRAVTVEK